jgi:amidohydrolase
MDQIFQEAQALFGYTQAMRRDFHCHPELGFNEFRTAGIVANELRQLDMEVHTGIAVTGVVGILEGSQPGDTLLLRFDMDALPVTEETGVEYASQNPGVMHACGHDGHTAIGLSVAKLLAGKRDQIRGTIKFVFQPAEEGMGGAERMIREGVLASPEVDAVLALHLWNEVPVGQVAIASGPVMAGADIFSVKVIGKGGHGAIPDAAVDPVFAAAQIVTNLQSIVSRNVSPLKNAVLSVTQIHGGETFNVIPPMVELTGTIRTFEDPVHRLVHQRFEEIVLHTAAALNCQGEIRYEHLTPPVVNHPDMTQLVADAAAAVLPQVKILRDLQTMGSEDMAFFQQRVPGCFFFVGSANPELGLRYGHHHPRFNFDENAMCYGVAILTAAALSRLA